MKHNTHNADKAVPVLVREAELRAQVRFQHTFTGRSDHSMGVCIGQSIHTHRPSPSPIPDALRSLQQSYLYTCSASHSCTRPKSGSFMHSGNANAIVAPTCTLSKQSLSMGLPSTIKAFSKHTQGLQVSNFAPAPVCVRPCRVSMLAEYVECLQRGRMADCRLPMRHSSR